MRPRTGVGALKPFRIRVEPVKEMWCIGRERPIGILSDDQPHVAAHHARLCRILARRTQLLKVHLVDGVIRRSHIAIAVTGSTARRPSAETSYPDRRIRLLHRTRRKPCAFDRKMLAVEGDTLALPQRANDLQGLIGARTLASDVQSVACVFLRPVAQPHAKIEASIRDQIEYRAVLCD